MCLPPPPRALSHFGSSGGANCAACSPRPYLCSLQLFRVVSVNFFRHRARPPTRKLLSARQKGEKEKNDNSYVRGLLFANWLCRRGRANGAILGDWSDFYSLRYMKGCMLQPTSYADLKDLQTRWAFLNSSSTSGLIESNVYAVKMCHALQLIFDGVTNILWIFSL